jgi:hypothetical protein
MQWIGKHVPVAMNAHPTIEELLVKCFLCGLCCVEYSVSSKREVGD